MIDGFSFTLREEVMWGFPLLLHVREKHRTTF